MDDVSNAIIEKIRRNRISTSEVTDCLGKTGVLKGVNALNPRHFRVGPIRLITAWNCSNWELHEQASAVEPGEIVIFHAFDYEDYAMFGALVAKFLLLYREAAALVVCGLVRDAHTLRMENYPIWCEGVTPVGAFNRKNTAPEPAEAEALRRRYEGAIAVCDESGVAIIGREWTTADFVERLYFIVLQEDAWFHCIDTAGMSTYETVCEKKYFDEESVFSRFDRLRDASPLTSGEPKE